MKKLFSGVCVVLALFNAFISLGNESEQILADSLYEEVKPLNIGIDGFDYTFKNNKDSLTLVWFDNGNLNLSWQGIKGDLPLTAIRYRTLGASSWEKVVVSADAKELMVSGLAENQILEVQFGFGPSYEYDQTVYHPTTFSRNIFKSNQAKGKEESAKITWGIENDRLREIQSIFPEASYRLKYNTKIGKGQNESDSTRGKWIEEKGISLDKVSTSLPDLAGGEHYVYKIGLDLGEKVIWGKEQKFKAERAWGIFKLLVLIGSLGMFIFGMKIMSEGLQQAAGSRLRNMLGSITSNRIKGVFTGFGITSVVQSSSVTTVMTVSFVNAGLMTLRQSAGVMMGANIGTTITAWLILLFGFKVDLSSYAYIFIAFGAPLLFFSKGKVKVWANVIIGFALLFLGLGELKSAVPSLGTDSPIVQFL